MIIHINGSFLSSNRTDELFWGHFIGEVNSQLPVSFLNRIWFTVADTTDCGQVVRDQLGDML